MWGGDCFAVRTWTSLSEGYVCARGTHVRTPSQVMNNLGLVSMARGDATEAEVMFESSLTIRERLHGDDHPDLVSISIRQHQIASDSTI